MKSHQKFENLSLSNCKSVNNVRSQQKKRKHKK